MSHAPQYGGGVTAAASKTGLRGDFLLQSDDNPCMGDICLLKKDVRRFPGQVVRTGGQVGAGAFHHNIVCFNGFQRYNVI